MFGFNKNKPGVMLDPAALARLSDTQLHLLFTRDKWAALGRESRLAALQEVENRRAKLDGRQPLPILEGAGAEFENPHLYGVYAREDNAIYINPRFLKGSAHHRPAAALETILHEGRHALQEDAVSRRPELVAEQVLNEWRSSRALYFGSADSSAPPLIQLKLMTVYQMQSIEIDARRFARRELFRIYSSLKAQGQDTRDIRAQLEQSYAMEARFIDRIQKLLTAQEIDALEKMVLEAMARRFPKMELGNLRLFDHARMALTLPPICTLENPLQLIDELDRYEEKKLDRVNEEPLNQLEDRPCSRIASLKLNRL